MPWLLLSPGTARHREAARRHMRQLLTTAQAADYLGIQKKTLHANWRSWGVPVVRLGGSPTGQLRFKVRDLDALIDRWTTEN